MSAVEGAEEKRSRRRMAASAWLGLLLWLLIVPGAFVAAPTLNFVKVGGFPLGYLMAASGSLVLLIGVVALIAAWQGRIERRAGAARQDEQQFPGAAGR